MTSKGTLSCVERPVSKRAAAIAAGIMIPETQLVRLRRP
jgi:hypothetical protein